MNMRRVNAVLFSALLLIWGLAFASRRDRTRRSRPFMPDMAYSLTQEAQGESSLWPGGMPPEPPEGSIPRGHAPLAYGPSAQEAERAGRELRNPFLKDPAAKQRGARVFANFCMPCHGASGRGDGPVLKGGVPAPPSLLGDSARRMADGRIFHIITYGQRTMPGHAAQISREDRWKAVLYVRELQAAAGAAVKLAGGAKD